MAKRPIGQHILDSFVHTHKPALEDAEYHSFDTMEECRRFEDNLPDWLGYRRD